MGTAIVIGGGIGGLATACLLAKIGYQVTLLEKNDAIGGVANTFEEGGFTFDMGPSWYLMPDVFASFFELLGEKVEDHLDLKRLQPSYRLFFKDQGRTFDFYSDVERDSAIFEHLEPGSSDQLKKYLELAKRQYEIALGGFMYKNYDTVFDFLNKQVATEGRQLEVFSKMSDYLAKFFLSDEVRKIMAYQLVFLGSSPYNTPALYNIMSHIDFNMGVFYPMGGIHQIPLALKNIAEKLGATIRTGAPVERILTGNSRTKRARARGVRLQSGETLYADIVACNAPIHHAETKLLPPGLRQFSPRYWKKRTLAPSAAIAYLGIEGRVPELTHHNLVFSQDWETNFGEIFDRKVWPTDPSFYVCAPSVTDPGVAPEGCENLFLLVPIAAGTEYSEAALESYVDKALQTLEAETGADIRSRIKVKKLFGPQEFARRYNTQEGTALGLAHTMTQTALLRPNNISKKVENLFYVGANTNPGIGMPIQLISAELLLKRVIKDRSAGHLTSLPVLNGAKHDATSDAVSA